MKARIVWAYYEDFARALGYHYGQKRCTRAEVRQWMESTIRATAECISAEYDINMAEASAHTEKASAEKGAGK